MTNATCSAKIRLNPGREGPDCQPPGTLVTVASASWRTADHAQVPIENLVPGDRVVSFSRDLRQFAVRGRPILWAGSHPFHGDLVTCKAGGQVTRYTPNHRCLVQVGDAFQGRFVVYLMSRGHAFRVGRCKGTYPHHANGAKVAVIGRAYTEDADRAWILGIYDAEGEAAVAEAEFSWRFAVPTMTFKASNRPSVLIQQRVDDFWLRTGSLDDNGGALLKSVGKCAEYPFWVYGPGAGGLGTRYLAEIRACNLESGMQMVPFNRDQVDNRRRYKSLTPVEVSRERYDGPVYSLEVTSGDPLYVADGLLTRNSRPDHR